MLDDNFQCFRYHQYSHREANYIENIRPNNYCGRSLYAPQIEKDVQYFNCNAYRRMTMFYRNPFTYNRG